MRKTSQRRLHDGCVRLQCAPHGRRRLEHRSGRPYTCMQHTCLLWCTPMQEHDLLRGMVDRTARWQRLRVATSSSLRCCLNSTLPPTFHAGGIPQQTDRLRLVDTGSLFPVSCAGNCSQCEGFWPVRADQAWRAPVVWVRVQLDVRVEDPLVEKRACRITSVPHARCLRAPSGRECSH